VWVKTSDSGSFSFNALKKNGIYLRPVSVHQYLVDEWCDRTFMFMLDGVWGESISYLYDYGNECEALTGGWSGYAYRPSGSGHLTTKLPEVSKENSSITLHVDGMEWIEGNVNFSGGVFTNKAVDVTNYNTLVFNIRNFSATDTDPNIQSSTSATLGVTTMLQDNFVPASQVTLTVPINQAIDGLYYVDVSNITGSVYVYAHMDGPTANGAYLTFDNCYLV
jgi:hypothetical protein